MNHLSIVSVKVYLQSTQNLKKTTFIKLAANKHLTNKYDGYVLYNQMSLHWTLLEEK